jgi:hypothetical protein
LDIDKVSGFRVELEDLYHNLGLISKEVFAFLVETEPKSVLYKWSELDLIELSEILHLENSLYVKVLYS